MKRLLSADLFALRKTKSTYVLLLCAVLLGALLPILYFVIVRLFDTMLSMDVFANPDESMEEAVAAMKMVSAMFTPRTVFMSSLPMTQGFGLLLPAMIGFMNARPFGTGIYRNKLISGCGRCGVYCSQSVASFLIALPSSFLYVGSTALFTRICFGSIGLTGGEWASVLLLTLGIYAAYTAISVFAAFLTRSVPLTLLSAILLPFMMNLVLSLVSPVLSSAPEWVRNLSMVLPSMQSMSIAAGAADGTVLAIALGADAVWILLFTTLGILRFRKTDVQ